MPLSCHDLTYIWAFSIWRADAFALMFKAAVFRRVPADLQFFFERTSSAFTHRFILVECSLRITHLNAGPTDELKIALEDKLNTSNSVFALIFIRSKSRKKRLCLDADWRRGLSSGESYRDHGTWDEGKWVRTSQEH